jgi:hypothetical protein
MVLHGGATLHAGESVPVTGLTETEMPEAAAGGHAVAMQEHANIDEHASSA